MIISDEQRDQAVSAIKGLLTEGGMDPEDASGIARDAVDQAAIQQGR